MNFKNDEHSTEERADANDSPEAMSYALYEKAWSDTENMSMHLVNALTLLKPYIASGQYSGTIANNYAAVLLDLGRGMEALEFLRENMVATKSCHANMAIAIAKTTPSNISAIRKYNGSSSQLPTSQHSIQAYMDWQAL